MSENKHIVSAHQPAYLPWLGYIHKIAISDTFVVVDNVQFEKDSFINRNKIKMANGSSWLVVPLKTKGHTSSIIKETEITDITTWQKKHWNAIYLSYKKAPYFNQISDFLNETYIKPWSNITELTNQMLKHFLEILNIKTKLLIASEIGIEGKKSNYVLDICLKTKADIFIFGTLGKDYAELDSFKEKGIIPYFQEYNHPTYKQLWGDFVPYMSVIDLIMNEGIDNSLNIILENNVQKTDLY